jgi:hypothetical protein
MNDRPRNLLPYLLSFLAPLWGFVSFLSVAVIKGLDYPERFRPLFSSRIRPYTTIYQLPHLYAFLGTLLFFVGTFILLRYRRRGILYAYLMGAFGVGVMIVWAG